jgi:non-canonical (house-cleaning) NTP pyrophosphatase
MYRQFQLLSNGSGAVAAGAVLLAEASSVQSHSRDYAVAIMAGPTTARPQRGDADFSIGVPGGIHYLDTTLGYIVVSDGTGAWRNPATGAAI